MSEVEKGELSTEWMQAMEEGINDSLDCYELFDQLINISPHAISDHLDERDFLDLTDGEQEFIKRTLFSNLEVDTQTPVRTYQMPAPVGTKKTDKDWLGVAEVKVYKTARFDEDIFLHEINYPDGKKEYAIAPKDKQI